MKELLFCSQCHAYTLKEIHCGKKSMLKIPAKWSPEDKYGAYRLKARRSEIEKRIKNADKRMDSKC